MTLILCLLPIFMTLDFVASQNSLLSSGFATPTCLQARQLSDPAASSITTALPSAVPDACNPSLEKGSTNGSWSIKNYQVDSSNFGSLVP